MLLPLLLGSAAVSADVYRWKDANGKVHLSDRPPADHDAERVPLRTYAAPNDGGSDEAVSTAPKVVMLSTTWCDVCRRARSYFVEQGIPFTEHDVERSDTGKSEFRRLNGKGVPIILVGDQRMDGFSAARLQAMLKRATP